MMNRNNNSKIEIIDRWFKVTIMARKPKKDEPEFDYSYTTGLHHEVVRREVQEAMGPGYIIKAEPIKFKTMIKEIESGPKLELVQPQYDA